jgi:hypothetical protein
MQNKRQVFTWPISLLIVVVSFLSVLVVLQQVQAAWVEPNYLPGATNPNSFVFNPLVQDLDLGGQTIIGGSAELTALTVGGVPVTGGGGGGGTGNDWVINYGASRALYFTTSTGSGNVGIGTNNPSHRLHILATASNSELDLQTGGAAGDGTHWGIYHANSAGDTPASSNDLRFWKGGLDRVTFTNTGEVGIGTVSPNKLLHLYSTSPNAELDIQSTSAAGSHWGIYHDGVTDQLRFWKSAGNNVLTLGANGRVGVGTTPDNSNMLRTTTATAGIVGLYGENSATDWSFLPNLNPNNVGVKGVANNTALGGVGVYGLGYHGVKGSGFYGIYGEATSADSGSAGVYGKQGTGHFAAYLEGDVSVTGNLTVNNTGKYLQITNGTGAPASGCTIGGHNGRLYVDITVASPKLYVCVNMSWRPISL